MTGADRAGDRAVTPRTDAVRADPDASQQRARTAPAATGRERAIVSAQLGRPARGDCAVVHRCAFGRPTVVRVAPRLGDGTPFPTVFWLTCPALRSRLGRLETDGGLAEVNARLDPADPRHDAAFAAGQRAAAERYVAFRDRLGDPLPGDPVPAGRERVKCLHAAVAHTLATGDNPAGRWALDEVVPLACDGPCVPARSGPAAADTDPASADPTAPADG